MVTHSYRIGTWTGLQAASGVALLSPDFEVNTVRALWQAMSTDLPLHQWLESLTAVGLSGLPDFALARIEGERVRILLRGPVEALADGTAIRAEEMSTWREHVGQAPQHLRLSAPEDGGEHWPLHLGVVRAAAIEFEGGAQGPFASQLPAQAAHEANAAAAGADDDARPGGSGGSEAEGHLEDESSNVPGLEMGSASTAEVSGEEHDVAGPPSQETDSPGNEDDQGVAAQDTDAVEDEDDRGVTAQDTDAVENEDDDAAGEAEGAAPDSAGGSQPSGQIIDSLPWDVPALKDGEAREPETGPPAHASQSHDFGPAAETESLPLGAQSPENEQSQGTPSPNGAQRAEAPHSPGSGSSPESAPVPEASGSDEPEPAGSVNAESDDADDDASDVEDIADASELTVIPETFAGTTSAEAEEPPADDTPAATDEVHAGTDEQDEPRPAIQPAGAGAAGESDAHPPVDDGDHDGHTVLVGHLHEALEREGAEHTGDAAENSGDGAGQAGEEESSPHQAPVATLAISTGQQILLDRTALLGRAPESQRFEGPVAPHLVAVPSPQQDISRTHVEITPEGDHVVITDLYSTNGTVVTLPGSEPRRLHPGESTPVGQGAVVDLGDGVTVQVRMDLPAGDDSDGPAQAEGQHSQDAPAAEVHAAYGYVPDQSAGYGNYPGQSAGYGSYPGSSAGYPGHAPASPHGHHSGTPYAGPQGYGGGQGGGN